MRKASGILFALLLACLLPGLALAAADPPVPAPPAPADNSEAVEVNVAAAPEMADAVACDCAPECRSPCDPCDPCADPCDPCSADKGYEFFGPLAQLNQHPPAMLFLNPTPDVATVLPEGERYFRLRATHANNLIRELDSGTIVDYDFETFELRADYHVGLGEGELSASLPYVHRGHGILDDLIEDWHKWTGLPNGNRNNFPNYMYRYLIVTRDGVAFNDEGDSHGLGDLTLAYKVPLSAPYDERRLLTARFALKLPLGDPDQGLGSGNVDYSLGLLYQAQLGERLMGYVNADMVFAGAPDWDNIGHQDALATLWALEYAASRDTTLVAQYRTHSNALVTGSFEADKDTQEMSLGFNHRLNDNLVWAWGFGEDLYPETAPDITLYTDLKWGL